MTWAREYYEEGYVQRWMLGPPSPETREDAAALASVLRLRGQDRVLDVGCGHGRHAVTLAQRGVRVVGVDFACALLSRATGLAASLGVEVDWVRADMRRLPIRSDSMNAVISLDAFGFFDSEDENEAVLREVGRVLTPGGRVLLKVANAEPMIAGFRTSDRESRGDSTIEITRSLLSGPPRLVEQLVIQGPQGSSTFERRQRLYSAAKLREIIPAAGLQPVAITATINGGPFDPRRSPSLVLVAERAAVRGG
jgi:SAM-dependent methyltransferase